MRGALLEGHPALTRYRSRHEIDSALAALDDSVRTPRTALEFWKLAAQTVGAIRDDHTSVMPNTAMITALYSDPGASLPLNLAVIGDQLYVTGNYLGDRGPPNGSEILSVNGKSARDFMADCIQAVPTDGTVALRAVRKIERDFELTCGLIHGMPLAYELTVRTPDGDSSAFAISTVKWSERRRLLRSHMPLDSSVSLDAKLELMDSARVAVLTMPNGFSKTDSFDPEEFLNESFSRIRASGVRLLVIDLRGNTGGTDRYAGSLFRRIARDTFTYYASRQVNNTHYKFLKGTDDWMLNYAFRVRFWWFKRNPAGGYFLTLPLDKVMKPVPDSFKGEVYLLIDGNSVSTSSEFASVFKARNRGTVIGEESGSAVTGGTGADVSVVLPNTQIVLNVPLMSAYIATRPGSHDDPARGVMPDIPVTVSLSDRLARRDRVLEKALELAVRGPR
jgi:hypothetical protein